MFGQLSVPMVNQIRCEVSDCEFDTIERASGIIWSASRSQELQLGKRLLAEMRIKSKSKQADEPQHHEHERHKGIGPS